MRALLALLLGLFVALALFTPGSLQQENLDGIDSNNQEENDEKGEVLSQEQIEDFEHGFKERVKETDVQGTIEHREAQRDLFFQARNAERVECTWNVFQRKCSPSECDTGYECREVVYNSYKYCQCAQKFCAYDATKGTCGQAPDSLGLSTCISKTDACVQVSGQERCICAKPKGGCVFDPLFGKCVPHAGNETCKSQCLTDASNNCQCEAFCVYNNVTRTCVSPSGACGFPNTGCVLFNDSNGNPTCSCVPAECSYNSDLKRCLFDSCPANPSKRCLLKETTDATGAVVPSCECEPGEQLDNFVANLLTDLTNAQNQADKETIKIANTYFNDQILRSFPVPRMLVDAAQIEQKVSYATDPNGNLKILVTASELANINEDELTTIKFRIERTDYVWVTETDSNGANQFKLVPA